MNTNNKKEDERVSDHYQESIDALGVVNRPIKVYYKYSSIPGMTYLFHILERIHILKRFFILKKSYYMNERIVENPLIYYSIGKYLSSKRFEDIKALDIACCESDVSIALSSLGCQVVALDIRDYPLKELCGKNFLFDKKDALDFAKSESNRERFDIITCISTIEHIGVGEVYGEELSPERKDFSLLKKVTKLLKKGGVILLSFPVYKYSRTISQFERHYSVEEVNRVIEISRMRLCEKKYFATEYHKVWFSIPEENVTSGDYGYIICFLVLKRV